MIFSSINLSLDVYSVYYVHKLVKVIQYEEFMRSILEQQSYSLVFSGHETFPLRQTWLKKIVDIADENGNVEKKKFSDPQLIAELGVGKNMLSSMKHWALSCEIIKESTSSLFTLTDLAKKVLSNGGYDPYSESITTTWLLHWILASKGKRSTSIYYMFNRLNSNKFKKKDLSSEINHLVDSKGKNISPNSLSKDLDVALRSYSVKIGHEGEYKEDFAEPVFSELGLVNQLDEGHFSFNRGPKESLNNYLFAYSLLDFWSVNTGTANTLSLDRVTYSEGSPGRVFKLDENSVAERLLQIEEITNGHLIWSDIAGIKQISRKNNELEPIKEMLLEKAYE